MTEPADHSGRLAPLVGLIAGAALFLVLLLVPPPAGLSPAAWSVAALTALMVVWWITEALPVAATALLPKLAEPANPLHKLWEQAKAKGIVDGVCRGCAHKMGTVDEARRQGLTLLDDMSGHPSMSRYLADGFEVISF